MEDVGGGKPASGRWDKTSCGGLVVVVAKKVYCRVRWHSRGKRRKQRFDRNDVETTQ